MIDVPMPQMGESIVEGTLTKWLKKPGERVERDEPLFEISTDKVDTEIPAPASGVLQEILVEEGKTVGINTIVGRIAEEGGAGAAAAPAAQPAETSSAPADNVPPPAEAPAPGSPAPEPAGAGGYPVEPGPQAAPSAAPTEDQQAGPLSPIVRKMAREHNIDLAQVRGTGAGGRITKNDVDAYIQNSGQRQQAAAPVPAPAPPPQQQQQPRPAAAAPAQSAPPPMPRGEQAKTRIEPMGNMRQKIAEHMIFSQKTSAHVTTVHKVDMTNVARLRGKQKEQFQAQYGFGLTFLPFVARAASEALRAFPIVNASIEGANIVYHNEINLGIAVALDGGSGLIVPVIRNADEKNVVGLQRSIVDLAARARSRQLKPDEVAGGTFSITNFGTFGSVFATPVINQPQVAILGVGTIEKVPVVIDDAIAIRSVAYLSLSFDHRLIDGALADQFMQKVKQVLENWTDSIL
ncbi:MAG TPA: 2-oxoglutarate dehydrogenase, E2 component, dihydrolipoamide succinyltransferase [Bryobacteraceae bacterium]|nr:2-oxoglutarate dehydrogenase, E2 component, dihydrolipoamide succinyltransferase [Bryobacteraceae bacterium]